MRDGAMSRSEHHSENRTNAGGNGNPSKRQRIGSFVLNVIQQRLAERLELSTVHVSDDPTHSLKAHALLLITSNSLSYSA